MSEKFTVNWEKACISESATIRDALLAISESGALMACVIKSNGALLGILTDSDLRRALLSGIKLSDPAESCLNTNPVVASVSHSAEDIKQILLEYGVREAPLVDDCGRLQDIFAIGLHEKRRSPLGEIAPNETSLELISASCAMLILAGGLGTRLRPVVSDRPKPLAIVGKKPILETIISRAAAEGIRKFYVSVNYMADQIERHLDGPSYKDLDITVLRESKRMGTAGSVSLINEEVGSPLIVANSDILTTAPLSKLLRKHLSQDAFITCSVRPHTIKIPFGVCEIDNLRISKIVEKPESTVLVNAGLYVLSPKAVSMVPKDRFFDMPDLVSCGLTSSETITPFYLHEYWIDIGKPEDFAKANEEFHLYFSQGID